MGKHETIKPSSTARVAKHRAEMKAKGYRLRQIWVPDMRDPKMQERMLWESKVIAGKSTEAEDQAWTDAILADVWADEPDY